MELLPYPPAEPMHILPWWIIPLIWLLLLVLAAVLLKKYLPDMADFIRRILRKAGGASLPGRKKEGILSLIKKIEKRNRDEEKFREGLFQLSEAVKSYLERRSGLQVEEMTSREINNSPPVGNAGKFFREMDKIVFKRKDPGKSEYSHMFRQAEKLIETGIKGEGGDADIQ